MARIEHPWLLFGKNSESMGYTQGWVRKIECNEILSHNIIDWEGKTGIWAYGPLV